ncbi:hypothetical protein HDU93_005439 [Gonapodya sp. JEL0774]|nr:hypothetical protein HDU93_005439 [Gonapodya sp. JEL0774]
MSPQPPAGGSWSGSFKLVADEKEKHQERIAKLRDAVKDMITPENAHQYDDLFILRFCMSNQDLAIAESSLRETIKWRTTHALLLQSIAEGGPPPHNDIVGPYCVGVALHKQLLDGSPFQIIRSGLTNAAGLMEVATPEQVAEWMLFQREEAFRIMDRRFFKALGISSKASEIYYPQLVGVAVMMNLPSWMSAVMSMGKTFMSQRTLAKLRICPGSSSNQSISNCPVASKIFAEESVPTFLGGICGSPGFPHAPGVAGCLNGVPNTRTHAFQPPAATLDADAPFTTVRVHAREHKQIFVGRTQQSRKLTYTVKINDTHTTFALEQVDGNQVIKELVSPERASVKGEVMVKGGCEVEAKFVSKALFTGSDVEFL